MRSPLFSIIILTYKRPNIIRNAVESVIKQEYNDYELLVVNEGYCDMTKKVMQEYSIIENIHFIQKE